jgi:hypothetical protein
MVSGWNEREVRARLVTRASVLENRLRGVKAHASAGVTFEALHDESLAKLVVYNFLLANAPLQTREGLLATLEQLRTHAQIHDQAFSKATFEAQRQLFITALIGQFTG